jgi:hypothetical protein
VLKSNPAVYATENLGIHMSNENSLRLDQFRFAFQMQNYLEKTMIKDTSHAKWELHIYNGTGYSEEKEATLGVHTCTSEEWA